MIPAAVLLRHECLRVMIISGIRSVAMSVSRHAVARDMSLLHDATIEASLSVWLNCFLGSEKPKVLTARV